MQGTTTIGALHQISRVKALTGRFTELMSQRTPRVRGQNLSSISCRVSRHMMSHHTGGTITNRVLRHSAHALLHGSSHDLLHRQLANIFVLSNQISDIVVFGAHSVHALVHGQITLVCGGDLLQNFITTLAVAQRDIERVAFAATGKCHIGTGTVR